MKNYTIHLNSNDRLPSSVGVADCDFVVRMSGEKLKKGQLFIQSLVIDSSPTGPVDFANINAIEVKSRSFQDSCSWNSNTNKKDVIAHITNQFSINNLQDFRYTGAVTYQDIGFPVQNVDFSDLLLNVQISSDDEVALTGNYHWHATLIFREDSQRESLVTYDKYESNYLNDNSF